MTAADTAAAEAAVTGITDQELTALRAGGWDDDGTSTPGWSREVKVGDGEWEDQLIFPSIFTGWDADCGDEDDIWRATLDEVLACCDERVGDAKPAEEGSATKQEDRFARRAEHRGRTEVRR